MKCSYHIKLYCLTVGRWPTYHTYRYHPHPSLLSDKHLHIVSMTLKNEVSVPFVWLNLLLVSFLVKVIVLVLPFLNPYFWTVS